MRRDAFLKTCAALLASGALPMSAEAAASLKMMIPANPGGGWDLTGRALSLSVTVKTRQRTVTMSTGWTVASRTETTATFTRTFDGTELVAADRDAMWAATLTFDGNVARQNPQNIPILGEMEV